MRYDIELSWNDLKSQVLSSDKWRWIYFDVNNHYRIFAKQNDFTVTCNIFKDDGSDQSDFEANYKDLVNSNFENIVSTQFERTDIVLKLAREKSSFSSGSAEISILVPGVVNSGDCRYVAGGYAFTDIFTFGDTVTKIQVVDVDNILGYGAHTVIKTYHDADIGTANSGWYMWPSPQVGGEVEIDPLGYYGMIPAGLYLEIYFEAAAATNVYCDIWWGKSE